jgi:hypothetical protein
MVRPLISHWEKLLTPPWVKVAWWTFPSWVVVHLASFCVPKPIRLRTEVSCAGALDQPLTVCALPGRPRCLNPVAKATSANTALTAHNNSARNGCRRWGGGK